MSSMSWKLSLVIVSLAFAMPGCTVSLAGSYEGDIDCGEFGFPMELEIDEDSTRSYSGSGFINEFQYDGENAAVVFDLEIDQPYASGPQELDVSAVCVLERSDTPPVVMNCDGWDELGWDGEDTIEAEIEDFFGEPGLDCDLEIDR